MVKSRPDVDIWCFSMMPSVRSTSVEVVLDIDDCASFPCGVDNECFDLVNGYTCSCNTGYASDNTSTHCIGLTQRFET